MFYRPVARIFHTCLNTAGGFIHWIQNTITPIQTPQKKRNEGRNEKIYFEGCRDDLGIVTSFSCLRVDGDGRATDNDQPALCAEENNQRRSPDRKSVV